MTIDTSKPDPNEAAGAANAADKTAPAVCPLNDDYIQLLPIRYAYVENLAGNHEHYDQPVMDQAGENKTSQNQQQANDSTQEGDDAITQLPTVTVYGGPHPVGYRFIRDGWLYIIDDKDNRIREYVLKDGVVVQRTYKGIGPAIYPITRDSYDKIEQEDSKELRIIFKKDRKIYISYSQVQWTTAKCVQMSKRAERKMFMQEVDLANVSCEHVGKHLLTREQAEESIAEVAEEYQPPEHPTEFETECTAYSWTVTPFAKASIGKLTSQVKQQYEQKGNYLFVAVYDYIGMMLDLENEQQLVAKWLGDWAEKDNNSLKYNVGNYIDSTLTITPNNAAQKGAGSWISSLPPEKQQAIYDYVNESIKVDQEITKIIDEKRAAYASSAELERTVMEYPGYVTLEEKKQAMIDILGKEEYEAHKDEINELRKNQELHYDGKFWFGRGVNQLVNLETMKSYLAINREKYNGWQNRLEIVTNARCSLYTNRYHMTTWYYDNNDEEQHKAVLLLEKAVLQDIQRNDRSINTLAEFLDKNPYYVFPAFQTNFTVDYFTKTIPEVTKWLNDTNNLIQSTINNEATPLQQLEQRMGNNYWRQLYHASGDLAELQRIHSLNLSAAVNQNLANFITETTRPLLNEAGQTRFNTALAHYEHMVNSMGLSARASFLLEIRRVGHVYISDLPQANANASKALNDINRWLGQIQTNTTTLNSKIAERNRLQDPNSAESRQLRTLRERQAANRRLTREITRLQNENSTLHTQIGSREQHLMQYISPLNAGEAHASLRFTISAEQQAALDYEQRALRSRFWRGYGEGFPAVGESLRSVALPTILLAFSIFNLSNAWTQFNRDKAVNGVTLVNLADMAGSITGTLGAVASVWEAAHSLLLNRVLQRVNAMGNNLAGAQLLGRLGRLNILLGGAGQFFGGFANYITLFTTFNKWYEGIMSGDTGKATGAAMSLFANVGNAAVSTYGLYQTTVTGLAIARELRAGQIAVRAVWAVRGARYATMIGRVTPVGLLLTAVQLIGEGIYNYYDLSEVQDWFEKSYWGKKNRGWNQEQHNQILAEALLKPIIIDQGVKEVEGKNYRVLQTIFPGQMQNTLVSKPIKWQAQWLYNMLDNPDVDITIGENLKQTTKLIGESVVVLEWKLPWLPQNEWSSAQENTLHLRLFYQPDMANQTLGGEQYGLGYKVPLRKWDMDTSKKVEQIAGNEMRIRNNIPTIIYPTGHL
ncbi:hypothetical protein MTZ49_07420 [Entomomonas sp. E2T0]|uniref:toxin VasX n=1 Tax=Entomomonas sp. E2T0 TaxID=2930213 RepID=UPI0022281486|nr:toxin VasX [Entomomonas sp. E2T0]UYZ85368.1 hypothetical protein MTZ49_07420 [Entomomonas sp. E2T0]